MSKREVLLVIEDTRHYYVDADTDEEAFEKAVAMLDAGERDQNAAAGWLHVKRHEVNLVDPESE